MGSANHVIASGYTNVPIMNSVLQPATGKEMQYNDLTKHPTLGPLYKKGLGNELGCLCQGIRDIQGTNNCFFVELANIPKDRKITYGKLLCGDIMDYTGGVTTSTAGITTFKILMSSTLSTEDAELRMMDIKNYYLGTPFPRYEYMRVSL
jgi:hypothetical protein